MTTEKKPKASTSKPADSASAMMTKALDLRLVWLQAKQKLTDVQTVASEVTAEARVAFETIRDAQNEKMAAVQIDVDSAAAALQAYNDQQAEALGIENPLGALGLIGDVSTGPTPGMSL